MRNLLIFLLIVIIAVFPSCEKKENPAVQQSTHEIVEPKVSSFEQATVDTFQETVYNIIKSFEQKDEEYLNSIISKEHGVIVLYRTGVFNEYKRIDKVDFNNPVPQNFQYPALDVKEKLRYERLPEFNCGTMEWSKHGLYCDTIKKDTLLSGTPVNLRKYRGDKIEDAEINTFEQLEKKSRRIVLATPNGDLIFYLTLLDNRWYLTVIDRITTDCSA